MITIRKDIKDFVSFSFRSILTYVAIASSIVTIIAYRDSTIIELRWLIVAGIVVIAVLNASRLLVKKRNDEIKNLKTEIQEIKTSAADALRFHVKTYEPDGNKDLFYIEYSEYLPEDTIVSIYYRKTSNKLVCVGRVLDVEPGSYTTVEVIPGTVKDGRDQLLNEIRTTATSVLENVYVKLLVKEESVKKLARQIAENGSGI